MAVNDELAAFHNHTNFGKDTQRAFLFAGASYADIIEELKVRDEKRDTKLIRYSEAYRGLHYPVHLLSCDETGARQLQIMAVPDYRVKLAKLMLRSAYRPPPEDAPAWDATYQNRPFVIGADMNLRRIDAAIASAKKRGCLPISLAALDAQGDAVLLRRYSRNAGRPLVKATNLPFSEVGWSSLIPMVQNVLDRYSLLMIDFKYQKSIISRPAKKGGTHGRLQTGRC